MMKLKVHNLIQIKKEKNQFKMLIIRLRIIWKIKYKTIKSNLLALVSKIKVKIN